LISFGRAHTTFAIVSTGKFLRRGRDYAVPVGLLSPDVNSSKLIMEADSASLQKAPLFNRQVWDAGDLGNTGIFSYSKSEQ